MEWLELLSWANIIRVFTWIGIYIILCAGLNLVLGFTGLFSLGHVGFLAVGAYSAACFTLYLFRAFPSVPGWLLFAGSIPTGAAGGLLAALAIGVPCLRLRGDYLAIATLAFAEIVQALAENIPAIGHSRGLPDGVAGLRWPESVIYQYSMTQRVIMLIVIYAFVVVTLVVIRNVLASSHGRALVAIRDDETAAALTGINITRYKTMSFALAGAFAGIAGALFAVVLGFFSPKSFGFELNIFMLLVVVLGGMGSLSGTVVAAVVLTVARDFLRNNLSTLLAGNTAKLFGRTLESWGTAVQEWWLVLYALLLITLMIFRPQGIFGKREIADTVLFRRLFRRRSGAGKAKK